MKTLEEFITDVRMENEYSEEAWVYVPDKTKIKIITEASEHFYTYLWQYACDAQKVKCAESATASMGFDEYGEIPEVDKDSILNAPSAVNPFKK